MSGHTPGPWHVDPRGGGGCIKGGPLRQYACGQLQNQVALATMDEGRLSPEERAANAHLLAAAVNSYDKHCGPRAVECAEADLLGEALEACKAAAEQMGNYGDDPEPEISPAAVSRNMSVRAFKMLAAVLAKAKP